MSHPRMRKPRPLGSLRHITKNTTPEKLPVIPNVLPEIHKDNEKLKDGIHGNAMAVPPPAVETTSRESRRSSEDRPKSDVSKYMTRPPKSSASSSSAVSHEHCEKDIKEGLRREKDLKDQISLLQKQIAELQLALRGKEDEMVALKSNLETQAKDFESKIKSEQALHEETKTILNRTEKTLKERNDFIEAMSREYAEFSESQKQEAKDFESKLKSEQVSHEATMSILKETEETLKERNCFIEVKGRQYVELLELEKQESEKKLQETITAKDAEIADRDQKLSRLKAQMAEALKGNSWERQQQLEELTKELTRIQEECDLLRMKIKSMSKNKQNNCSNCDDSNAKLAKAQSAVKERDANIKELKALISKFESQLSKQDKLLEHWAATKGQKITAPR